MSGPREKDAPRVTFEDVHSKEFETLRREAALELLRTAKLMAEYARVPDRRDATACADAAAALFTAVTK